MWSASSLVRHCAHVNVLKRAKPRTPNVQEAADRGTAFHAAVEQWIKTGEAPELQDAEMTGWLDLLTSQWSPPADASTELAWGLGVEGDYIETIEMPPGSHCYVPADPTLLARLLTAGRADVAWVGYDDLLYVVDWKTGRWPATPADRNLQVNAAGIALCRRFETRGYVPGVYYVRDGVFEWGLPVEHGYPEFADMFEEVFAAAVLPETPIPGPHCAGCWERRACPSADNTPAPTESDPF